MELKECKFCNKEKELTEFNKHNSRKDGLQPQCRACHKKFNDSRKHNYKSRYNVPDKCVYAFKEGKEFMYIGESDRTPYRIAEHLDNHTGRSFAPDVSSLYRKSKWSWHILWYGNDDANRKSQEKELIKLHRPKYNKRHNNG